MKMTRSALIRLIASTLVFSDPPLIKGPAGKQLETARDIGAALVDALDEAGALDVDDDREHDVPLVAGNGAAVFAPADDA